MRAQIESADVTVVKLALLQILDLFPVSVIAGASVLRHLKTFAPDGADEIEIVDTGRLILIIKDFGFLLPASAVGNRAYHQLDALAELDSRLPRALELGPQHTSK